MRRLPLVAVLFLAGCASLLEPKIGMTYNQWARRTLVADLVYAEGNVKAYRVGPTYHYFKDDVLVKIDQGLLPAQTIRLEVVNVPGAGG